MCKIAIRNVSFRFEKRSYFGETVTCDSALGKTVTETVTETVTSDSDRRNSDLFHTVSYFAKYETVNPSKCDPKKLALIIHFLRAQNEKCLCMEPEPPGAAFFLPGAGAVADPIWSEPESAPGPRTSRARAAQKSGSSATLHVSMESAPAPHFSIFQDHSGSSSRTTLIICLVSSNWNIFLFLKNSNWQQ